MAVATVLQLLRQAGEPMWVTLWAEDGRVFYDDATRLPLSETILQAQAGYALVVPRVLASIGAQLPPSWFASWAAVSSALLVSLLALFTYFASRPLLRSPLRQGILAGTTFLLPVLPWEVLGALCNLQWFVALPCLLAVLFPVERTAAIAVRGVIATLGPLTAPLAVLIAPVAAWQVIVGLRQRRSARTFVVPVLYLVSSAVQVIAYLGAEQLKNQAPPAGELAVDLTKLYGTKVVTDLVFGVRTSEWAWRGLGYGLVALATGVLVVLLGWKVWRGSASCRRWVLGLVAASVVLFVLQFLPRSAGAPLMVVPQQGPYSFPGMRWEIFPALLVVLALLVPLDTARGLTATVSDRGRPPARGRRISGGLPWRGVAVVLVLWVAVALVPSFRFITARSEGPVWSTEVERARSWCVDRPAATGVAVGISPQWQADLTCGQIE